MKKGSNKRLLLILISLLLAGGLLGAVLLLPGPNQSMDAGAKETASAAGNQREATPAETAAPQLKDGLYADANGGAPLEGNETRQRFPLSRTHLRTNTPLGQRMFARDGFEPLCWNTRADGGGEQIVFGGRTDSSPGTVLYLQWEQVSEETDFSWTEEDGHAIITGWKGKAERLVIPHTIRGMPVTRIGESAFAGINAEEIVLPFTLREIGDNAFQGSAVRELWLYDSLEAIGSGAFDHCENLSALHVSADTAPRYAVSYFAAFADKMDWLRQESPEPRLILAGGSATRYAYSSNRLRQAFPDYRPVNMGVYAYSNMLPQYRLMLHFAGPGDVLLSAPEFDTAETQFCVSNRLDTGFWAMLEADYTLAGLLDFRQYSAVFSSLSDYLRIRSFMPERAWEDTPKAYDDDGNALPYSTYNQYGDYTLVRPGAPEDKMLMYFRADYTADAFPEALVDALNGVYREWTEKGVQVLFACTPRNQSSLTEGSTPAARRALDSYLRDRLTVPVILDVEESLYPGQFFYLIDSHLCDEGVYVHTQKIIQALKPYLEAKDQP